MAMQIALNDSADFTLNTTETRALLRSSGISNVLKEHHPKIHALVKYNAVGAIKLLVAAGCISGGIQKSKFNIKRKLDENDSVAAWSEYKNVVKTWLTEEVNDAEDLEPARTFLCDEICDEWCRKAPNWPAVGQYGPTYTKDLVFDGKVESDDKDYIYLWSILGTIKMRDFTESVNKFTAEIWGDPRVTMKCVRMDQYELRKWNKICIQDFDMVKKMAKRAAERSVSVSKMAKKLKTITFDSDDDDD